VICGALGFLCVASTPAHAGTAHVHDALCQHGHACVAEFRVAASWTSTAAEPARPSRNGTPLALTWGFMAEGTIIPSAFETEPTGPSSLVSFLDGLRDPASTGGADLTQRAWFPLFAESFARLDELSGVRYTYEPKDDGFRLGGRGFLGLRADVRIGAHPIDGNVSPSTVAYNYFPDTGDMVLDTDNADIYNERFFDSRAFRNIIMHEAGHGLGLAHLDSDDSAQLMEPRLDRSFLGPQFDDILGLHRSYGDARESGVGNDTRETADFLGTFQIGETFTLGADAGDSPVVTPAMTDFVSIDGLDDEDWFRFSVTAPAAGLSLRLTPRGPTYLEAEQDGTQQPFETSALNDLTLSLIDGVGDVVTFANATALGGSETILADVATPSDWYVSVKGLRDTVQMYSLEVSIIPEPAGWAAVGVITWGGLILTRRRRDGRESRRSP
jgi:hypothetical protein